MLMVRIHADSMENQGCTKEDKRRKTKIDGGFLNWGYRKMVGL